MNAGADRDNHYLKPSRTWQSGWVFAVVLSLLIHAGLFKVLLWVDSNTSRRPALDSPQGRVIDAQLLPAAPPKDRAEPVLLPGSPAPSLAPSQGGRESVAHAKALEVYLEPSQVDLTAQPLEEPVLDIKHWPRGVDELRVTVWVSPNGAIVDWHVLDFERDDPTIQQTFTKFSQTRMSPALKDGQPVASVLYLALNRP